MEALKILQKAYAGSVKMIYIDPPYNTGSDSFIYPDKFSETREEYAKRVGDKDDLGYLKRDGVFQGALRKNSRDNGHYHSNWLNMMLPRLHLAKTLLREDGVIFISIDDNEQAQLKLLCDEVFGAENFLAEFIRKTKSVTNVEKTGINIQHEYLICYAKNKELSYLKGEEKDFSQYQNPDNDPNGEWISDNPTAPRDGDRYPIVNPFTGREDVPPKGRAWFFSKENFELWVKSGKIKFKEQHSDRERGFILKRYKNEIKNSDAMLDSLFIDNSYLNQAATKEQVKLFEDKMFDSPKSVALLQKIVSCSTGNNDLILDFFSGSGTTAHAVMQLNAEDGGKRRYICVQLPEETEEKSEARKAGFATIAEIAKERIRRAGAQIRRVHLDAPQNGNGNNGGATSCTLLDTGFKDGATSCTLPDTGFKVFKLAESNFKQWRSPVNRSSDGLEAQLEIFRDVVEAHATVENMAYELALRLGFQLTDPMIFSDGVVWLDNAAGSRKTALLLETVSDELLRDVLAQQPQKVFALDKVFGGDDALKTNAALQCQDAGVAFETL
ncbi:site-specific DNA-methyltransferase [Neisseria sp.]|uniref:site-specific DNA-methyltransferase n=1 Tax=Neisseria sp. TaxID=192066 RepID=UPI0026DAF5BD|nr:site-specific DNA-methyltransferase [Neisseria sp.]MDO4907227.1 site-specific DNA-methyltransferase [Neisseria sp.]